MKYMSLARFKKLNMLMPKDIAHWPCQERYDVIRRNADCAYNQGEISLSTREAAYSYATRQLMK